MPTRKFFIQTAETIAAIKDTKIRKEQAEMWAIQFAKANSRFNKKRFFSACGVEL